MGTLASELAPHAHRLSPRPRVYADANIPARLVTYMRQSLGWDVLFVIEDPALRRASDVVHFKLAAQLSRTLLTLDRDYLDDQRFPPREGRGVLVLSAPNDRQLTALISRVDRVLFASMSPEPVLLPLAGTKLEVHTDWRRDAQ
jgi:predicted nuclease of predicted toxin-antitoxin system